MEAVEGIIRALSYESQVNVLYGCTRIIKQCSYSDAPIAFEEWSSKNNKFAAPEELIVIHRIIRILEAESGRQASDWDVQIGSKYIDRLSSLETKLAASADESIREEAASALLDFRK